MRLKYIFWIFSLHFLWNILRNCKFCYSFTLSFWSLITIFKCVLLSLFFRLSIECPFIECPKKKKWSKLEKHKKNCQFKVKKPLKILYKCTICKKDHFRSLREFTFHTMKSHAKLGKKELKSLINRATLPPSKRNPLPL